MSIKYLIVVFALIIAPKDGACVVLEINSGSIVHTTNWFNWGWGPSLPDDVVSFSISGTFELTIEEGGINPLTGAYEPDTIVFTNLDIGTTNTLERTWEFPLFKGEYTAPDIYGSEDPCFLNTAPGSCISFGNFGTYTGTFNNTNLFLSGRKNPDETTGANGFYYEISAQVIPTVKFIEYYFSGKDGDKWTYINSDATRFTYTYENINVGPNEGCIKIGNSNGGVIFEISADNVIWHELIGEAVLTPPFVFPSDLLLNQQTGLDLVVLRQSNITVQSENYNDVIVLVWLDRNFPSNIMNTTLGLEDITASGVTDVDWYAKGVGLIKRYGVNAETGENDGTMYELLNYTIASSSQSSVDADSGSGGGKVDFYLICFLLIPLILRIVKRPVKV